MAKKYELLYVLNGTLPADELRAQMSRVNTIVETSAENVQVTEWGRRRLAYEIQDLREGYYVIVHFNAEPEAPREIERLLRIADYVLRYLIVVAEGSFMPSARRLTDEEEAEEATESVPLEQPDEQVAQDAVPSDADSEARAPAEEESGQAPPQEEEPASVPEEAQILDENQAEEVDGTPEEAERNEE